MCDYVCITSVCLSQHDKDEAVEKKLAQWGCLYKTSRLDDFEGNLETKEIRISRVKSTGADHFIELPSNR